jgi:gas vesicle protein
MNNKSKIMIALAAGLAAGAILGVLFAPAEGEETRKKITDTGKDLADAAKKKIFNGTDKLTELKEEVLKKVDQLVS